MNMKLQVTYQKHLMSGNKMYETENENAHKQNCGNKYLLKED